MQKHSILPLVLLAIGVFTLMRIAGAQKEQIVLTMDKVMTAEELKDSGVSGLTVSQRQALDAWLNRYTTRVIKVLANQNTKETMPRGEGGKNDCAPTVESAISGDFNGWEGETIFKLDNGQIWQQAEYDYSYSYSYHPDVTIYRVSEGCRMKVEDEDETILVRRIK